MIVRRVAVGLELNDISADQKLLIREMHTDLFVPFADDLHLDPAARQIDLDVEFSVLADKILFLNADRAYDKSYARSAHIYRFARDRHALGYLLVMRSIDVGFEPNTHRSCVFSAIGNQPLGKRPIKPIYQFSYHLYEVEDDKANLINKQLLAELQHFSPAI